MRLVSWTLAGPGTAAIIGDALRSVVPIADEAIVVWTGDGSRLASRNTYLTSIGSLADGPTVSWKEWPWRDDFGAARNAALDFAALAGADWSTMVDTDERVVCPDSAALRSYLAALAPDVVVALAHSEGGTFTRERFFRHFCGRRIEFVGRTHEQFRAPDGGIHAIVPREIVHWTELPKTPAQLEAKNERDVAMLRADIIDDPKNAGAHFYLGSTLQAMGRHEEAIDAWREQLRLDSGEGGAWGAFKAGESYLELGQWDRVIDCCLQGMARDAGIAELPWLAAIASLRVGRWEQARCWAEIAKTHGLGSEASLRRTGFKVPRGLTVGPDEVLEFVRRVTAGGAIDVWEGTAYDLECLAERDRPQHIGFDGHIHQGSRDGCAPCDVTRAVMLAEEHGKGGGS